MLRWSKLWTKAAEKPRKKKPQKTNPPPLLKSQEQHREWEQQQGTERAPPLTAAEGQAEH